MKHGLDSAERSGPGNGGTSTAFRALGIALLTVSIVLFAIVLVSLARLQTTPPLPNETESLDSVDFALKDFNVVNAHDHLYKREHLPKYLDAAERTGISRTLLVASSSATLIGSSGSRSEMTDENSALIISLADEHPGRIIPFCTIYPGDPDKLEKLKKHVAAGAVGLKLYSGHQNFHEKPLDDREMMPIYRFCERTGIVVCWHVNLQQYRKEFTRVMDQVPDMKVIVPHFGQAYWRPDPELEWIGEFIETYPNLYTDTSLGTRQILVDGLLRVSQYRHLFKEFCEKYSDRILFGTDMVITGNREKTALWIESVIRASRDVLEKDVYYFPMAARGSKYGKRNAHPYGLRRGLDLDDEILRKIYETNPEKLFPTQPNDE